MADHTQTHRQAQPPSRPPLEAQTRAVVQVIRSGLIAQADGVAEEMTRLHAQFPDMDAFVRGIGHGMSFTIAELIKVCEDVLAWN